MLISCLMTTFSDWLNNELADRQMSPAQLAKAMQKDQGIISRILSNSRAPSSDTLTSVARALHLPPDYVFEKAGILPPKSDLSPIKRAAIHAIESATDDDVEFINEWLNKREGHKKLTLQTRLK